VFPPFKALSFKYQVALLAAGSYRLEETLRCNDYIFFFSATSLPPMKSQAVKPSLSSREKSNIT